ncbi:hypothetical protein HYDPIDRAFT_166133 [Hydnomerulius pinastri MD-312]|nr:hypothetical protein HYDPIDRAFT_166133 [Hydnomerulius pinastri MD-312]
MSPSSIESGTHLTTSRINRLLRPLRNKCVSLCALPQSSSTAVSRATHSKQSLNWDPDGIPPLTVTRPSAGAQKLTLNRSSVDEFELSRRIHAVCDAFRNVAHVAYGNPCTERIPSLAAICTLVIGQNIPIGHDGSQSGSDEESADDDDIMKIVDDIYDAIPSHYRRFSIVSHALSMILLMCAHHHTLINILLDHCLSFGLVHESIRLLNIILSQALLPTNSSYQPPITHPAHTTYLVDLHAKWITSNKKPGSHSESHLFTTSSFCQAVLSTLLQSSRPSSHALWTSKPLNKMVRAIQSCDINSFISIAGALAKSFWDITGSSPGADPEDGGNTHVILLRDHLSEWITSVFDALVVLLETPLSTGSEVRTCAVVDILDNCRLSQLHAIRGPPNSSQIDLPDIITVLATRLYITLDASSINASRLVAILEGATPIPATFTKLIQCLYQPTMSLGASVETLLSQLALYSSALRSQKLFRLDASLWACALRHFETAIATSQHGNSALVTKYKGRLMDAVDAAERRCFGGDMPDSSPSVPLTAHSKRVKGMHRRKPSGHWEWEEMVGCWIRKTPVHKKRKVEESPLVLRTPSRKALLRKRSEALGDAKTTRAASASTSASTSSSTSRSRSCTFSRSSSSSQPSESDAYTEESDAGSEYQDDMDKENYPSNPLPPRKLPQGLERRQSNFSSLLADAQVNRITLHSEAHPKPKPKTKPLSSGIPEKYILPLSSQQRQASRSQQASRVSFRCPTPPPAMPPVDSFALLPSDDSLDLFAYATSSPARG